MTTIKNILRADYPEVYHDIQKKISDIRKQKKQDYMKSYLKQKDACVSCGGSFTRGQYVKHTRTKKHQNTGYNFLSDSEE